MGRSAGRAAGATIAVLILLAHAGSTGAATRTYSGEDGFAQGSSVNLVNAAGTGMRIDDTTTPFNFIWVAVSSKGTIVKIDTDTGIVKGEYRTAPQGQPLNPSRTTVDKNGSVWTANRDGSSVVHVGLEENGQCLDRNGNGRIDTSAGYGDVKAWTNIAGADTNGGVTTAADECIVHYTRTTSSGTRHISVTRDNDVWVSGTAGAAQRFNLIDGDTGTVTQTQGPVGYGGYGGLIDPAGVIWSARPMLRWDTKNPLSGSNGLHWRGYGHDSYGLCIGPDGHVWNTSLSGNRIYRFTPDGTQVSAHPHGHQNAQGCVVDRRGHVWVAHSVWGTTVGHLRPDGSHVGNVTVGGGPTGVAVDARGKIWSTGLGSQAVSRIDPDAGALVGGTRVGSVDLTTRTLGGQLYNYSDMTGSTLIGAPDEGTWSVVYDSEEPGAPWGAVDWEAQVPEGGALDVSVASSDDGVAFGPVETALRDRSLGVDDGRYLRIAVSFDRSPGGETPVLESLTVRTAAPPEARLAVTPESGTWGLDVVFDGSASSDLDDDITEWRLDVGDGSQPVSASGPPPAALAHVYADPGTYTATLEVEDADGFRDSASVDVTVLKRRTAIDAQPAIAGLAPPEIFLGPSAVLRSLDPAPAPLADADVRFTAGGRLICTARTDATGTATCTDVTALAAIVPALGYEATFAEDARHLGSTDDGALIETAGIRFR